MNCNFYFFLYIVVHRPTRVRVAVVRNFTSDELKTKKKKYILKEYNNKFNKIKNYNFILKAVGKRKFVNCISEF